MNRFRRSPKRRRDESFDRQLREQHRLRLERRQREQRVLRFPPDQRLSSGLNQILRQFSKKLDYFKTRVDFSILI